LFDGKRILITGGTGSLGRALTKKLLDTKVDVIRIFSREELKQVQMESEFEDDRLRFLIGDVRDKQRLARALEDIDMVFHTAALKQVPVAEYNPFEAVKTNVFGTQNLIDSCLDEDIELAVAIGTDKAVAPFNTYGATKFLMERLFITANYYKGKPDINFLCIRYGNVLGSRGSIVPTLINQIQTGKKITITDHEMTRFTITMNQAIDLIFRGVKNRIGGAIFIPKLKAYKVGDIKEAVMELMGSKNETVKIPVRSGEKFHESLIGKDEMRNTFESNEDYIIFDTEQPYIDLKTINNLEKAKFKNEYSSDKVDLLSKDELKKILLEEKLIPSTSV